MFRNKVDEEDVDLLLDELRNTQDYDSRQRLHRILNLVKLKNAGMVAGKTEEENMRDVIMGDTETSD